MGKYSIVRPLDRGGYSRIFVVESNGKLYACKTVTASHVTRREVSILRHMQGAPHVVKLHDVIERPDTIHIVMELCNGGNIGRLQRADESHVKSVIGGCVSAVSECHDRGVIHNDIKPENFMFTEPHGDLKIIDFGISMWADKANEYRHTASTPWFTAPELLESRISFKSDVWAVGVMTYFLLFGLFPFNDKESVHSPLVCSIWRSILNDTLIIPDGICSESARDFLTQTIIKDPGRRLDIHGAAAHPWLRDEPTRKLNAIMPDRAPV